MNRNDYQSGWDTDQFPNNVPEMALAFYEILKAGGFTTGGTNFDAKLRRQSLDPQDLLLAHIGGMDTCARGAEGGGGDARGRGAGAAPGRALCGLEQRGGEGDAGRHARGDRGAGAEGRPRPEPRSGKQERLENLVNRFV